MATAGSSANSIALRMSNCSTRRARKRSSPPWKILGFRRCPTAWCGSFRVREQGPGLCRRHGDEVCPHRHRVEVRRPRQGHHHSPPAQGPADFAHRRPPVQAAAGLDFVQYYDLTDLGRTFDYEEEIVSGKPVNAKVELELKFDAKVVLWGPEGQPADWNADTQGAYVDLHQVAGRVVAGPPGPRQVLPRPQAGKKASRAVQRDLQTP